MDYNPKEEKTATCLQKKSLEYSLYADTQQLKKNVKTIH
jgi:hypothetical protein